PLLERQHVDPIRFGIDARRVAYDVDEPIKRVQAAEQIIVFAVGARQKRGEMAEPNTLQALNAVEPAKRMDVLRTDAVDQNLVELAQLARARHRERQYVPEWKAEIIDSTSRRASACHSVGSSDANRSSSSRVLASRSISAAN